ncbi:MAG TPA: hypothetical protein PKL39_05570 [Bacillota bacterium]|nr:hypothetical protein [Bacillota bacterium]HPZ90288.1 hypothetical protein [Bacillota bacterium]HQE01793.1 hypothetical protein [Bacillota bacterium]
MLGNQRGSILVTVIVIMVCLLLLGTAMASMSIHDQRQTVRQQKNAEAMYIARGGAEAVAAYLLQNPEAVPELLSKGQDEVILPNGGKCIVEVTEDEDGTIYIASTGYSGEHSERLTFTLEPEPVLVYPTPDPKLYFPTLDMAIFAEGRIELGNSATVIGDIGTYSVKNQDVYLSNAARVLKKHGNYGNVKVGVGGNPNKVVHLKNAAWIEGTISNLEEERRYPLPIFPEFPELPNRGNLTASTSTATISESGWYNKITVTNSGKLIINAPSGETIRIRAKSLELNNSSEVIINGDGKVVFYIEETFEFSNSSTLNKSGSPDKVMLYYAGASNKLKLRNSTIFNGSIYAKTADIDLANGGEIWGNIITGGVDVKLSNASKAVVQAIYAPNALVTVHNSAYVMGAIVCKQYESKNSCVMEYAPEITGIWDLIPDIEFETEDPEPIVVMKYIKGSWSK